MESSQLEGRYGIPKDAGGDSPSNTSRMERCVEKVMASGKSKESAIRICKTSMFGQAINAEYPEQILANCEVLQAVGRMLSKQNLDALRQAVVILQELILKQESMYSEAVELEGISFEVLSEVPADQYIELMAGDRLGSTIQKTRQSKLLTIDQVVKSLPISESVYRNIESGYLNPPPDVIEAIASVLSMDADELKRLCDMDKSYPVYSY